MKAAHEVVQDWVATYNQRDTHAAAGLHHEDATNFHVALGAPSILSRHSAAWNVLGQTLSRSLQRRTSAP